MTAILELKNVSYQYPLEKVNVIELVSLKLEEGKVYGLIGANDAGKTTLCTILRGFIPTLYKGTLTGEVQVLGKPIASYNIGELAEIIGYSFQNPFTQISGVKETVYEEIAYGMENLGFPQEKMRERVDGLMALFNLEKLARQHPFELSGGQKQRVALASIVALDPKIIILDEPTSQLDPKSTKDIFAIINKLKELGKTILIVEHKVDLLAEYCDKIVLMDQGEIALEGQTEEVLSDPKVLTYGGQLPQVALYFLQKNAFIKPIPLTVKKALEQLRRDEGR